MMLLPRTAVFGSRTALRQPEAHHSRSVVVAAAGRRRAGRTAVEDEADDAVASSTSAAPLTAEQKVRAGSLAMQYGMQHAIKTPTR